jgi:hypothetical protein
MTDNSAFLAALGNFYFNSESGESYSCLGARTSLASAYSRAGGQAPYSLTTATTSGCFSSLFECRTRQTRETISTTTKSAPTEPPTAPAISDVRFRRLGASRKGRHWWGRQRSGRRRSCVRHDRLHARRGDSCALYRRCCSRRSDRAYTCTQRAARAHHGLDCAILQMRASARTTATQVL